MRIDNQIQSQLLTMKEVLDKELETYETEKEKEAFVDGITKTINMIFVSR